MSEFNPKPGDRVTVAYERNGTEHRDGDPATVLEVSQGAAGLTLKLAFEGVVRDYWAYACRPVTREEELEHAQFLASSHVVYDEVDCGDGSDLVDVEDL